MDIYYINNGVNPNILAAVYNRDRFSWQNTIQVPYSTLVVDELDPANKALCLDITNTQGRRDAAGLSKYYVGSTGVLMQTANWQEVFNG